MPATHEELHRLLTYLVSRFDEVHPPNKRKLNIAEETGIAAIEELPGGKILGLWLKKWLKRQRSLETKNHDSLNKIYGRFKRFFLAAKSVTELSKRIPPEATLPTSETDESG